MEAFMKKIVFCAALLALSVLTVPLSVFAQATVVSASKASRGPVSLSVGTGPEVNQNAASGVAGAWTASSDCRITRYFAAGVKAAFSTNIGYSNTLEAAAFARAILPVGKAELFLQGGGGVSAIYIYEGERAVPMWEAGAGVRVPLGRFYAEPAARFGAPYLWGAGVSFGTNVWSR
jgi:hypothetical protein